MEISGSGSFRDLIKNGKIFHALIISGASKDERKELADEIAAAIVCRGEGEKPCRRCQDCRKASMGIHPDIAYIEKEKDKREIIVDQVRSIRADAAVLPNEANFKVYVIIDADDMNPQAQNAMLKTLEEPPSHAKFILIAENPSKLLETVRSRCVELSLVGKNSREAVNEEEKESLQKVEEAAEQLLCAVERQEKASICEFAFCADKFSKEELLLLSGEIKKQAASKLKNTSDCKKNAEAKRYMDMVAVFDRVEEYVSLNIGTGHIMSMIMAELL